MGRLGKTVATGLLAAMAGFAGAQAPDSAVAPATAPTPVPEWELKGLRLGDSLETIQAAAPGLVCETHAHDTGLTYCLDKQSTLGGESAFLVIKLLDGAAVYIALENLTYAQMTAAVPTMLSRYGTPAFTDSIVGDLHEGRRVRTVRRTRTVWRREGDQVAAALPFNWTDENRGITYSSVSLMLEAKLKEWGVRYHARERATDL